MEKKPGAVKRFFGEFKKFITRGNVLDMAVGVIIGSAFTAIVTALSNGALKPLINKVMALIFDGIGLEGAVTFLSKVYKPELYTYINELGEEVQATRNVIDMQNSLYIDWGGIISAVINFLIVAFVLFMIIRTINKFNENREKAIADAKLAGNEKKEIKKIAKEQHVSKKTARAIYAQRLVDEMEAKAAADAAVAAEAAAKAAEEARIAEEKAMANTLLLQEIRDLLKNSK